MTKKFKNFKEFGEKLNKVVDDASGNVTLNTLFNQAFMAKYSTAKTIDEMFDEAGINIDSEDDFKALSEETKNSTVSKFTSFSTWEDMLSKASEEYMGCEIKKRL